MRTVAKAGADAAPVRSEAGVGHVVERAVAGARPVTGAAAEADRIDEAVAAHYDDVLRMAWLMAGDQHRAEDAVGEALAKMLRASRRKRIDDPRAYLRRAVVNEVNSSFRRLMRERVFRERRFGDGRGERAADDGVADRDALARALACLPERQRVAVVLFYYEDLSQQETADAMGCSVGTAKSNVSRGLAKLRALLEGEES